MAYRIICIYQFDIGVCVGIDICIIGKHYTHWAGEHFPIAVLERVIVITEIPQYFDTRRTTQA